MANCNCGGSGTIKVTVYDRNGRPVTLTESCPCTYGGSK